jgi:hypothetical protein
MRARSAILLVTGSLVALALTAGAQANKVQINKADQAKAVASLVQIGDLPAALKWTAGKLSTTPTSSSFSCKGYNPKSSDLVTTGKASITFDGTGVHLESEAQLLKTAKMVQDDYNRTFVSALGPCLGSALGKSVKGLKVLRVGQINFPKDAPLTAAYRVLYTTPVKGQNIEGALDLIALGNGREEVSLTLTAILGTSQTDEQNGLTAMAMIEQSLASKLAKRALGIKAKA